MVKLTKAQLGALALEALREHFPYEAPPRVPSLDGNGDPVLDGEGNPVFDPPLPDSRTLRNLRRLYEEKHLGGFLRQFQVNKAARELAEVDPKDLD